LGWVTAGRTKRELLKKLPANLTAPLEGRVLDVPNGLLPLGELIGDHRIPEQWAQVEQLHFDPLLLKEQIGVADDNALSGRPSGPLLTEVILRWSDCLGKFLGLQRIAILLVQLV
jgi:hypothetical protein